MKLQFKSSLKKSNNLSLDKTRLFLETTREENVRRWIHWHFETFPISLTPLHTLVFKEGKNGQSDTTPFEQAPEHKGERGPSRSGRGGRGRGGARRGRAFDRHSGSGFKDGEKKEVAGHSWGDPVASALEGAPATEESPADGWNGDSVPPAAEDGAAGFEDAEPAEPEPEYKTLDEFLSSNSAAAKKAAEARRKANEGVDESQWKGTTLLKKEEQLDSWFAGLAVNNKSAAKKKERQAKTTLEIEQTFAAPREERGGFRGGRGRGQRGGRTFTM